MSVPESSENPGKLGNTKQVSCARKWCFTYSNYENVDELISILKLSSKYGFGYEIAPTTGTPHLQG